MSEEKVYKFDESNFDKLNGFIEKNIFNLNSFELRVTGEAVVKDKDGNIKGVLKLTNEGM